MTNYYYPDTNHDDKKVAEAFLADLTPLTRLGVKTVFMEFLGIDVPEDKDLIEHFADCSGGRRHMGSTYCNIVREARRLGLRVIGLALGGYSTIGRQFDAGLTFRMMGPFDAITAAIIGMKSGTEPYVVFLGSGHWPLLSFFLPGMQLRVPVQESMPKFTDILRSETYLVSAHQVAKTISRDASESTFLARGCEGATALARLAEEWQAANEYAEIYQTAQDKLGVPPDITQINYMIAKRGLRILTLRSPNAALTITSNPSPPFTVKK
jgi:hypothetical protein